MGLLSRLLGSPPRLGPEIQVRLQRLSELSPPSARNSHRQSRYVTVAVETTGPDVRRDRVLSIAAVAVDRCAINLADCFEVALRPADSSSRENTLLHRIGGQRQSTSEDLSESVLRFLEYVVHCPLVAFDAGSARALVDRMAKEALGTASQSAWLDLGGILLALYPSSENRTMADWLRTMNIRMPARHDTLAEALATAQMLQVGLHQAECREINCPEGLLELQRARR